MSVWSVPETRHIRAVAKYEEFLRSSGAEECVWLQRVLRTLRSDTSGVHSMLSIEEGAPDAELLCALGGFPDKRRLLQKTGLSLETCIQVEAHLDRLHMAKSPAEKAAQSSSQRSCGGYWLLKLAGLLLCLALAILATALSMNRLAPEVFRLLFQYAFTSAAALLIGSLLSASVHLCLHRRGRICCCCRRRQDVSVEPIQEMQPVEAPRRSARRLSTRSNDSNASMASSDAMPAATVEGMMAFSSGVSRLNPCILIDPDEEEKEEPQDEKNNEQTSNQASAWEPGGEMSYAEASLPSTATFEPQVYSQGFALYAEGVKKEYEANGTFPYPLVTDVQTALYLNPAYSFASRFARTAAKTMADDAKAEARAAGCVYVGGGGHSHAGVTETLRQLVVDTPECAKDVVNELRPHLVDYWNKTAYGSEPNYPAYHPGSKRSLAQKDRLEYCARHPKKKTIMPKDPGPPVRPASAPPLLPGFHGGEADSFSATSEEEATLNPFDVEPPPPPGNPVGLMHPSFFELPAPPISLPPMLLPPMMPEDSSPMLE